MNAKEREGKRMNGRERELRGELGDVRARERRMNKKSSERKPETEGT